jgi:GAF domain-containing protein
MSTDLQKTVQYLQRENIRLKSENNALKDHLTRVQQAVRALNRLQHSIDNIRPQTNIYRLLNDILSASLEAVDSADGSLLLLDEDTGELVFVEVIGEAREILLGYRLQKGIGIAGWTVKNRRPKLVEDTRREPSFSPLVDQVTGMQTTSLICVPLFDGKRDLGAIEVVNTRSGLPFAAADKDILMLVGRLASLAIIAAERTAPS